MTRRTRTMIIRMALAAALGVVTSVGVAWIISAWHVDFNGTQSLTAFTDEHGGWSREKFGVTHLSPWVGPWEEDNKEGASALSQRRVLLPAINAVNRTFFEYERPAEMEDWIVAVGWPWRCGWSHAQQKQFWMAPTLAPGDPAIDITPESLPGERKFRVLPLRPLWLGLAGNVVFYGALWFGLLSIPALFRALRRRRGRCAKCGYNLKGISSENCPECGAAVTMPGAASRV